MRLIDLLNGSNIYIESEEKNMSHRPDSRQQIDVILIERAKKETESLEEG